MIEKTPNSPAELLALNEKKDTVSDLKEMMKNTTLREALVFVRDELEELFRHHKKTAKSMIRELRKCETEEERDEMTEAIDQWLEDTKHLQAAWDQVRLVELGPERTDEDEDEDGLEAV